MQYHRFLEDCLLPVIMYAAPKVFEYFSTVSHSEIDTFFLNTQMLLGFECLGILQ